MRVVGVKRLQLERIFLKSIAKELAGMRHQGKIAERIKGMNKRQGLIVLALGAVFALALYMYFGHGRDEQPRSVMQKPLVQVMELSRRDMMRHVVLSGQTVAAADIALAPKYSGRIAEVRVELGDRVEAGEILLVQDTADLDISILEQQAQAGAARADAHEAEATYEANYLKARTNYELEKSKYERNEYLFSIGAISQDTLDSVRQEFMASQAAFEILENQVEDGSPASVQSKRYGAEKAERGAQSLLQQREDMYLRAPRAGIIGYRKAEVGELVTAGTKLLSLVDNSHTNVDCTLSESDAAILEPGMEVQVTIDALGCDYPGRITYVSPAMDAGSKTYQVRVELQEDETGEIKAGLFAHTALDILQRPQTLFVPKGAVLSRSGRQTVWVLDGEGRAREREVRIGLMNDEMQEILSGLSEGDAVIITNQDRLQEGMEVEALYPEAGQEAGEGT